MARSSAEVIGASGAAIYNDHIAVHGALVRIEDDFFAWPDVRLHAAARHHGASHFRVRGHQRAADPHRVLRVIPVRSAVRVDPPSPDRHRCTTLEDLSMAARHRPLAGDLRKVYP